jgi:hypothetical protein
VTKRVWIGESVYWIFTTRVTTISSYTLKIAETIAHISSTLKLLIFSIPTAVPLELRNSSEVNSKVKVKVILRLTTNQSVSLGIEHPPGAHDQILLSLYESYCPVQLGRLDCLENVGA